jgi:hypothetical protein
MGLRIAFVWLLLFAIALPGQTKPAVPSQDRLIYLMTNLLVDSNVDRDLAMLSKARRLGYTGVMVADSKFCRWGSLPAHYLENCTKFREGIRKLGLKFIACVAPIGYSNDLLATDPNLAEGLPVVDVPFVATSDGHLVPVDERPLKNGNFSEVNGDAPARWDFVDGPGKICTIDRSEAQVSLRMSDIGRLDPVAGHARAEQTLHLEPFRYYHVSAEVKTQDFDTSATTQILALGANGQALQFFTLPIQKSMPWKRLDVTFNTLDNHDVSFYIGVWGGKTGAIWWRDIRIEPSGLVNLVRRPGAPFTVKSADGNTLFAEHKDYENAVDPKMGNHLWLGDFDAWHDGPVMTMPAGSSIKPGVRVLVSYCHTALIYDGQAMVCMEEPKVKELLKWQIAQVHKNLQPDGYMLSHDEIRMTGWDASCQATHETPGQILAANVAQCIKDVREADPEKTIYAWSDMFDPTHNAQSSGKYYLVRGDGPWSGSWKGLDRNVVIVNWQSNPASRSASLAFFNQLGCKQILAGYYDGPPDSIISWLADATKTGVEPGIMYTTWVGNFSNLDKFIEAAQRTSGKAHL